MFLEGLRQFSRMQILYINTGKKLKGIWTMSCNCANLMINAAGYPFTWASNYGGRIQFNSMPEYVSADMAYRIQSNWLNQRNMFCGCSGFMPMMPMQMPYMMPGMQMMPMPQMQQMPGMQYSDPSTVQGYIDGRKTRISVLANQSGQNLTASKTELENLLNDPTVTDEQKQEINKYLTKINEIQTGLQNAVQQAQSANNPQMVDQINNQVEALMGMAQELLTMIPEMLNVLIQEAEQVTEPETPDTTPDTTPDATPGAETPDATAPTVQVIAPEGSNPEDSLITTTNKEVSQEVLAITEGIYNAVNGIGFSNKDLKAAVEKINKDNVLDVFDNWNASYAPGYINTDKQGLIETIYGEHHFYNGGKEEVTHILNALTEKAAEFGQEAIQNIDPLKAQINSELNAWFNTNESKVAEAINKIVLILNAYQAQAAGGAETTSAVTQA